MSERSRLLFSFVRSYSTNKNSACSSCLRSVHLYYCVPSSFCVTGCSCQMGYHTDVDWLTTMVKKEVVRYFWYKRCFYYIMGTGPRGRKNCPGFLRSNWFCSFKFVGEGGRGNVSCQGISLYWMWGLQVLGGQTLIKLRLLSVCNETSTLRQPWVPGGMPFSACPRNTSGAAGYKECGF